MKTLDICSVGNALMDILVQVDEVLLGRLGFSKGTMNLIDEITLKRIHAALKNKSTTNVPAGACVNTVVGMASLGGSSAFTGHLGNDDHSLHFERDLSFEGVKAHLHKSSSATTGQVYCLITPDGERTMATYLGASIGLDKNHVNADLVKTSKILYLTGYELESGTIREAALHAIRVC
ncbi:MAG TPA: PfkB family carbohydrate kinase [Candidatus Nanoarchaeia archaeon]|nr:PfkB family carbohydrate kinase [Candidatus Nanoarchaeia archaeon]